jgi:hypothetical protein
VITIAESSFEIKPATPECLRESRATVESDGKKLAFL